MGEIALEIGASTRTISFWLHQHGIGVRSISETIQVSQKHGRCTYLTGPNHPHWQGVGRFTSPSGYVLVRDPTTNQYVREHRLVMERFLGRPLRRDEIVHHINGVKADNRIENLMVLSPNQHSPVMQYEARIRSLEAEVDRLRAEIALCIP
jgi:hypothetical protein